MAPMYSDVLGGVAVVAERDVLYRPAHGVVAEQVGAPAAVAGAAASREAPPTTVIAPPNLNGPAALGSGSAGPADVPTDELAVAAAPEVIRKAVARGVARPSRWPRSRRSAGWTPAAASPLG